MKDYRYYFSTPFHCDSSNIYDDCGEIVGSYYGLDVDFLRTATARINGVKLNIISEFRYDRDKKVIRLRDKPMIYIRGSTHLVLNCRLSAERAEEIQHELGEFFVNQLNKIV